MVEALRSGRASRVVIASGSERTEGLRSVLAEAERQRVSVEHVDRRELDAVAGDDHQGVVAFVTPPRELDERELRDRTWTPDALVVVLDGMTDPQNFGACARSAEAAGAELLLARHRRAAPFTAAAVRASAGALLHLPVARVHNLVRALESLQDRGFTTVGLDQRAQATIHDAAPGRPLALVVGAEGEGISRLVRERCDLLVSIPMPGRTASLNASAALSVALFGFALRPRTEPRTEPSTRLESPAELAVGFEPTT
ncbi:MAG TPA: 23S rRNA (guanosine(2251)-2'-O)-methyltransferase RlmB [Actinobacteria bacterium]|nr:23S rRNA (guanosine(2251)-2'-O)-methyltransferase RlmB [Actinomycetota bacterium]HCP60939.1 23S rRNA (guanosine(2251)-2'-O)-methyltransferase RlmB [Actinomycetota bacterium]